MSMSKKDYEAIAAAIKSAADNPDHWYADGTSTPYVKGARSCASAISSYCAQDNPRFDTLRFLAACGVQS